MNNSVVYEDYGGYFPYVNYKRSLEYTLLH